MDIFEELTWRGQVQDATEGASEFLKKELVTAYIGFDPSASSLHVGSLVPMMTLARLQRLGHSPVALVGGGTGLIGDPSGKTAERQLLSTDVLDENLGKLEAQLRKFLDFESKENPARLVDNGEWLRKISFTDFLRDVGKYFTVNYMLAKESVKVRLDKEDGISFTEFSYMLLQAYDFLVLSDRYDVNVQIGGSDQWGNITAGIALIRRLRQKKAHGLVFPLVTTSKGIKFGKTEAGAVWLDPEQTSPYRFYQFWLNVVDADVIKYLRTFTWLEQGEIAQLEAAMAAAPHEREAQRKLAREVTLLIHGETEVQNAERATRALFGGDLSELGADEIADIFADVPSTEVTRARFDRDGLGLIELVADTELASSKGDARRSIAGGGIYVNNVRAGDTAARVGLDTSISGRYLVLRKGAKKYHLIKITD